MGEAGVRASNRVLRGVGEHRTTVVEAVGDAVSMKRPSASQWKDHIRFHRGCRTCRQEMGCDTPHWRRRDASSSYVMSADVAGPFCVTSDFAMGARKMKHALVATIPIPYLDKKPGDEAKADRGRRSPP